MTLYPISLKIFPVDEAQYYLLTHDRSSNLNAVNMAVTIETLRCENVWRISDIKTEMHTHDYREFRGNLAGQSRTLKNGRIGILAES